MVDKVILENQKVEKLIPKHHVARFLGYIYTITVDMSIYDIALFNFLEEKRGTSLNN